MKYEMLHFACACICLTTSIISGHKPWARAQLIQLDQACGLFLSERIGELESTCLHRFSTCNMHFIFDLLCLSSHNARTAVAKNTEIMENILGGWFLRRYIWFSSSEFVIWYIYIYIYIYIDYSLCTIINCKTLFLYHEIHYTKSYQPSTDKDLNHWIDLILLHRIFDSTFAVNKYNKCSYNQRLQILNIHWKGLKRR